MKSALTYTIIDTIYNFTRARVYVCVCVYMCLNLLQLHYKLFHTHNFMKI